MRETLGRRKSQPNRGHSMPSYTQTDRPLTVTTPAGKDVLLVAGFRGHEAISQLFRFQVDLLADVTDKIRFDQIVGGTMTVEMRLTTGDKRWFNGLVTRFSQGGRDEKFLRYRAELAPKLWLLTKKIRSRIFQQLSTPDILRAVLMGLDVTYQIHGTYYPRDYCVQYRESDFDFASRLMEEEGIYYFFLHTDSGHQMIVTDTANQHPAVPGQSSADYDEVSGGVRNDMRVTAWEKSQELRSGEYTLWDHCFELPGKTLEVKEKITDNVKVGKVAHKLNLGGNDQLEIYEYPGGYAQRFDGIDRNGVERRQDLKHIIEDGERTARIRMEEQEARSLEISGASDCGNFTPGHVFTLERHFDADGTYLLTHIEHKAQAGGYRGGQELEFSYENRFTCIPDTLPYRPPRVTATPVIAGIQTATVVGAHGEEIFCDKYGRVKVQFHWDREGKKDQASSCWVRVSQVWAGKGWGAFFWPRIGHEVVVAFEDGIPDQPLIVGSVYNADNMPPFELPRGNKLAGWKSASYRGRPSQHFNGILMCDEKGHEHIAIHSERHMRFNTEFDKVFHGGRHKGERVAVANVFTVGHFPTEGGSGGGPGSRSIAPLTLPGGGSGGNGKIGKHLGMPKAQGLLGLNATMVFGGNVQTAVGINHQLAVGSNYQICVNPAGLLAQGYVVAGEPILASALAGGIGGNVQFTIGTNAQITYGRNFEINVGAPKVELNNGHQSENTLSYLLCGALGLLVLAYVVLYGIFDDDDVRATLTIVFQACIDVTFGVLVGLEGAKQQMGQDSEKAEEIRKSVFEFHHVDWTPPPMLVYAPVVDASGNPIPPPDQNQGVLGLTADAWKFIGAAAASLGMVVAPLVVAAQNEHGGDDDLTN
jgi:type VI secretion system secreted protein VgrG